MGSVDLVSAINIGANPQRGASSAAREMIYALAEAKKRIDYIGCTNATREEAQDEPLHLQGDGQRLSLRLDGRAIPMVSRPDRPVGHLAETLYTCPKAATMPILAPQDT